MTRKVLVTYTQWISSPRADGGRSCGSRWPRSARAWASSASTSTSVVRGRTQVARARARGATTRTSRSLRATRSPPPISCSTAWRSAARRLGGEGASEWSFGAERRPLRLRARGRSGACARGPLGARRGRRPRGRGRSLGGDGPGLAPARAVVRRGARAVALGARSDPRARGRRGDEGRGASQPRLEPVTAAARQSLLDALARPRRGGELQPLGR